MRLDDRTFNITQFFEDVRILTGINCRLCWADSFVVDSKNHCLVYHCEVEIAGEYYRTNVPIDAKTKDWAKAIERVSSKIGANDGFN